MLEMVKLIEQWLANATNAIKLERNNEQISTLNSKETTNKSVFRTKEKAEVLSRICGV